MKKKETYVPQFELPEESEKKTETKCCQQCGKQTVSLHKGICFDCRNKATSIEKNDKNNGLNKYLKWVEKKSYRVGRAFSGNLFLQPLFKFGASVIWFAIAINIKALASIFFTELLWLILCEAIAGLFVVKGVFSIIRKKRKRIEKYYSYCDIEVPLLNNDEWKCPCCGNMNLFQENCEICGIAPRLIVKEQDK